MRRLIKHAFISDRQKITAEIIKQLVLDFLGAFLLICRIPVYNHGNFGQGFFVAFLVLNLLIIFTWLHEGAKQTELLLMVLWLTFQCLVKVWALSVGVNGFWLSLLDYFQFGRQLFPWDQSLIFLLWELYDNVPSGRLLGLDIHLS